MKPTTSVCIPAYNAEAWIGKAIDSALDQTVKPDEVVVGDDLSTDRTVEVAEAHGAKVLRLPKGFAGAARNAAAAAASGEILFFLDADDWWHPRKVETHLKAWEEDPQASAVLDRVAIMWDEERVKAHSGTAGWRDWKACADRHTWTCGSSFSIRKSAFLEIGGFNTEILWGEDVDVLVRLAAKFGPAFGIDEVLTYYRYTAGSLSKSPPAFDDNLTKILSKWSFASEADKRWFTREMALMSARRTPLPQSLPLFRRARWPILLPFFWKAWLASCRRTLERGKP